MTLEEKARAYDEALKIVKQKHEKAMMDNNPIYCIYEEIFPELAESEDESIRRCIGMALTDVPEQRFIDFGTTRTNRII